MEDEDDDAVRYLPTPEQIWNVETAAIQRRWTDKERWRRAGYASGKAPPWNVPLASLRLEPNGEDE